MSQGWISVHRSLANHWLWEKEKFTKGQAWIDLLLHANHKENKAMIKGRLVVIQRGEQIRSQVTLAETWKWNPRTVKKFLELLSSDGMITLKSTELTTHITICNYDTFQDMTKNSTEQTTQHPTEHSAEGVQSTVQTNNNVNNANNVNNDNKKPKAPKGCRLSQDDLPDDWLLFCKTERPDLSPESVFAQFKDYWAGVAGAKGVKLDWLATWRNWVRNQKSQQVANYGNQQTDARSRAQRVSDKLDEIARDDIEKNGFAGSLG